MVSRQQDMRRSQTDATKSVQQFLERGIGLGAELGRDRVMLFSLLSRWRRRGRVNDSEIKMRVGVIWVFRDCLEQFFFGGFLPAFLTRRDTEVIVRGCALRIESEGFG